MATTIHDYKDAQQQVSVVETYLVDEVVTVEEQILNLPWNGMTPEGYVKGEAALEEFLVRKGVLAPDDAYDGMLTPKNMRDLWEVNELQRRARGFFAGLRALAQDRQTPTAGKLAKLWVVPVGTSLDSLELPGV